MLDGVLGRVLLRDQRHPRIALARKDAGHTAAPGPVVLEEGQIVEVEGRKAVVEYHRQNRDEPIVLVPRVEGAEDES